MKTLPKILLVVLAVVMVFGLFACNKNADEVVIKVDSAYEMEADDTLEDYMDYLEICYLPPLHTKCPDSAIHIVGAQYVFIV